jgi:hypothetical protein
MTEDDFRRLALCLPEAVESTHMAHPDFRVGGKIFATLRAPGEGWAMVKLPPDQQEAFVRAFPSVFEPVKGTWGLRGATNVRLAKAKEPPVRHALRIAWRDRAPRRLVKSLDAAPRT